MRSNGQIPFVFGGWPLSAIPVTGGAWSEREVDGFNVLAGLESGFLRGRAGSLLLIKRGVWEKWTVVG